MLPKEIDYFGSAGSNNSRWNTKERGAGKGGKVEPKIVAAFPRVSLQSSRVRGGFGQIFFQFNRGKVRPTLFTYRRHTACTECLRNKISITIYRPFFVPAKMLSAKLRPVRFFVHSPTRASPSPVAVTLAEPHVRASENQESGTR